MDSSVTDTMGLVFWKDPVAAVWKEDGWDVGPHEQQGGQLGTPSTRPEASQPLERQPALPASSWFGVITVFSGHIP